MKISKKVSQLGLGAVQLGFEFVGYVRPAVLSLSRYSLKRTGVEVNVAYETWLEWASPLSTGIGGGK